MEVQILICNVIAYAFLLIYVLRLNRNGKYLATLIVTLFFISSFCSVLFFDSALYRVLSERHGNRFSILALIYIYINLLIYIKPYSSINIKGEIVAPRCFQYDCFKLLIIFVGFLSVIPFVENMIKLSSTSSLQMTEAYFDKKNEIIDFRAHLSIIGRFCSGICSWFKYITPILFFYALKNKMNWLMIILSIFAFLNPVVVNMLSGARGGLYETFCILLFNLFLFKDYLSKKYLKLTMRAFAIIALLLLAALLILTVARADGDNSFALNSIYRYLGESFSNFAEAGWFVKNHTNGHSIINGTGFTFWKDVSDYFDARDYAQLGNLSGVRMYVFYTVFGDYYIDFGFIGGILFNALLAFVVYMFVRNRLSSISSFIILNLYARIGFNGIYYYAYMYAIEYLAFTILIAVICRKIENTNRSRILISNY